MNIYKKMIKCALESQKKAYTPYSNFNVGASVLTDSGKIYGGCNIENASYTPTVCAERVVGKENSLTYPCGVCRQVMREFCTDDCEIIIIRNEQEYKIIKFSEILPYSFGPKDL